MYIIPRVYRGDSEHERELVYLHLKLFRELERTYIKARNLANQVEEKKLTVGETRDQLIELIDIIEAILAILRRASTLFNQLNDMFKSRNSIQHKWAIVDLLYHHMTGMKNLLHHHLDRGGIPHMLLHAIANDLVDKLDEVEKWRAHLAIDMRVISYINTPPEERDASTDSNRTLDRENGEDLEDSDDPPGDNSEDS